MRAVLRIVFGYGKRLRRGIFSAVIRPHIRWLSERVITVGIVELFGYGTVYHLSVRGSEISGVFFVIFLFHPVLAVVFVRDHGFVGRHRTDDVVVIIILIPRSISAVLMGGQVALGVIIVYVGGIAVTHHRNIVEIALSRVVAVHKGNGDAVHQPLIRIGSKSAADKLPVGDTLVKVKVKGILRRHIGSVVVLNRSLDAEQTGHGIRLRRSLAPARNGEHDRVFAVATPRFDILGPPGIGRLIDGLLHEFILVQININFQDIAERRNSRIDNGDGLGAIVQDSPEASGRDRIHTALKMSGVDQVVFRRSGRSGQHGVVHPDHLVRTGRACHDHRNLKPFFSAGRPGVCGEIQPGKRIMSGGIILVSGNLLRNGMGAVAHGFGFQIDMNAVRQLVGVDIQRQRILALVKRDILINRRGGSGGVDRQGSARTPLMLHQAPAGCGAGLVPVRNGVGRRFLKSAVQQIV